jgi:hypothetical protein
MRSKKTTLKRESNRSSNIKWPASLRTIGRGVVEWWDAWLDFEVITLVWFFAQLTIVLGPPATFGLYYVANVMAREGEALGVKGMIQGARMYFGKALLWGLFNWLALILGGVNIMFYYQVGTGWGLAAEFLVLSLVALWLVTQFYAVAFFMEQTNQSVFLALRNGLYMTLASPFYTLILMVVVLVLIGISGAFVIPLFLGSPALIAVLGTRALFDRLIALGLKKPEIDPKEVG